MTRTTRNIAGLILPALVAGAAAAFSLGVAAGVEDRSRAVLYTLEEKALSAGRCADVLETLSARMEPLTLGVRR